MRIRSSNVSVARELLQSVLTACIASTHVDSDGGRIVSREQWDMKSCLD